MKKSRPLSVAEGDEPGDVLHQMIMAKEIGYGFSPLLFFRWRKRDIVWSTLRGKGLPDPVKKIIGHEVLFRPTSKNKGGRFAKKNVGKAFWQMTEDGDQMIEAYPVLLDAQLRISNELIDKFSTKKSVNLEYIVWDDDKASEKVFELLWDNGRRDLVLEIKEDGMMPEWVMKIVASLCEETGVRLYIDDLAMKVNDVSKNIEYFQLLIRYLHRYIIAVKVDYAWVSKVKGDPTVKRHIERNLHDFAYIWKSYTSFPLPAAIYESRPFRRRDALEILINMAKVYGYTACYFQSEE